MSGFQKQPDIYLTFRPKNPTFSAWNGDVALGFSPSSQRSELSATPCSGVPGKHHKRVSQLRLLTNEIPNCY